MPIWIGLFRTLGQAAFLRQATFLYIDDLTLPDRLYSLDAPLFGIVSAFNLLPVLYVILTIINQRLQPRPTDPQMQAQYRMMTIMMVFFGFIFYSFASGFMLYIMTSSAIGILESKLIKRQLAAEDDGDDEVVAAPATAYPAKRSGSSARSGESSKGSPQATKKKRKGRKNKRRG